MEKYSFRTCCPIMLREVLLHEATFRPDVCACDFPKLKERLRGDERCPSNKQCFLRTEHIDELTEEHRKLLHPTP